MSVVFVTWIDQDKQLPQADPPSEYSVRIQDVDIVDAGAGDTDVQITYQVIEP